MSDCTTTCNCKQAQHEHGTRNMYVIHKCRGTICRKAATLYEKNRQVQRLYGIECDRVDAQPAREHIQYLRDNGISYRQLAKVSGVSHSAITAIIYGRTERGHEPYARILPNTAKKILAIKPTMDNMASGRPIDAIGTHRRIQALVTLGYSLQNIGERLNISRANMSGLMTRDQVVVGTARKVRTVYEQLWDKPNTATEWQLKGAATRARNLATLHGWCPPMAWDDDMIDDPSHTSDLPDNGVSKIDAKRIAFLEEVEHFAGYGDSIAQIAISLELSQDTIAKRLERYDRLDLIHQIGWPSKAKAA